MTNSGFDTLGEVKCRFPGVVFQPGFDDRTKVFVKSSHNDIFRVEFDGLESLRQANAIRVAHVVGVGGADRFVLVLEAIESCPPTAEFFERFAQQLAELHQRGGFQSPQSECGGWKPPPRPRCFGFGHDNFLGATVQPNPWTDSWTEFFAEHRLGFQLQLAKRNGLGGSELQNLGQNLMQRLDVLIDSNELPTMIHGDLWSGNWICDDNGDPALIDPAVYYANREAEFGMTTLFGGLPPRFYGAYNEAWPMDAGWEDRVKIYRLYHLLNHLNLFGISWLSDCLEILRRFA